MHKISFLALVMLTLSGCTQTDRAEHTLRVQGFKNIEMTGYAMFGCGRDDNSCDGFIAEAPNGERVVGVVACRSRPRRVWLPWKELHCASRIESGL